MYFYVDDELINIEDNTEPYGIGTEGQVYKIGDEIFKLYFYDTLDEGYGNKYYFHKYLKTLNPKQIALPQKLIYDIDGNYVGYTAHYVDGDVNENNGLILLPSELFINNLRILEEDIKYLSREKVLMADVSPWNTIFDKKDNLLFLIDPGRYQCHSFDNIPFFDYRMQNMFQFNLLIGILLDLDFKKYNPVEDEDKSKKIITYIIDEINKYKGSYLNYFESVLEKYENVTEYAKTLKNKIN